jgi:carboxypeptidase Q
MRTSRPNLPRIPRARIRGPDAASSIIPSVTRIPRKIGPAVFPLALLAAAMIAPESAAAASPTSPADDGTMPGLEAIAGRGMMNTRLYSDLAYLTDRIGGRLTGSPAAGKAVAWAVERMKAAGLANVHTEDFEVKRGWTRGSASVEIVSPVRRSLAVTSLGWVGSTPAGGVESALLPVDLAGVTGAASPDTTPWTGRILFVRIAPGTRPRASMIEILRRTAEKARVAAILVGPFQPATAGMQLAHTTAPRETSEVPIAALTAEGHALISRSLDRGEEVRVRLDVQNRLTAGPVPSANVIGEIPGTEHAGEVVLVGAHLDSWDLASGATDDGFGAVSVLGAAEAVASSGRQPRRTIRFVLFTGEEQGFLGSLAYTRAHRSEIHDFVAALILDSGAGPIVAFDLAGRRDLMPAIVPFTRAVRAFGDVRADDRTEFATDTLPFTLEGVPGINLEQDSPDYDQTHHSAADTFDRIRPDYLLRDATLLGLAAYWIAARPERLATPWPPEKTARMLVDLHEDGQLRLFGLWPFGDLDGAPKDRPDQRK